MAQVPYQPLSEVRASGGVPGVSVNAPTDAFGGAQATALQKLGGTLGQAGQESFETAMRFQQQQNETDANDAIVKYGDVLGGVEQELKNKKGNEATAYLPTFQKTLKKSMDDIAGTLQSPMARLAFSRNATGYYERSMRAAGEYVGAESTKANIASYQGVIDTDQSQAVRSYGDPESFQASIGRIAENSRTLAHAQGLDANAANHLIQLNVGKVYQNVAAARIATGDTSGARQLLDQAANTNVEGTNLPIMDRVSQLAMLKEVESKEAFDERHKYDAENQTYMRYEHQRKMASDQAWDVVVTQLNKDPFSVDDHVIGGITSISGTERLRMQEVVKKAQTQAFDGSDKGNGDNFVELYKAVHAPEGAPEKITDRQQVYDLVGHGLTTKGANQLVRAIKDTPEEKLLKDNFFKDMEEQIVRPNGGSEIPGARTNYQRFLGYALDAFDKGLENHKTIAQMTNPDSPDYVGKPLEQFKPKPGPNMLDDVPPPTPAFRMDLLNRIPAGPQGREEGLKALRAAVAANPKIKPQAEQKALEKGWARRVVKPITNGVPAAGVP